MKRGEPLDDADRAPWLSKIRAAVGASRGRRRELLGAQAYGRDALGLVCIVLLDVPEAVARGTGREAVRPHARVARRVAVRGARAARA